MSLSVTPYKGLMPYSEEDAKFFFGREAEKEIITANLMASRLTLLYGASGVGKSSVLRAGVSNHIRELTRQNLIERQRPDFVVVVFSSWRDDPVRALPARVADAVGITLDSNSADPVTNSRSLAATLEAWTDRIEGDLLIILDQFEEYFLYHSQEDGEGTFAVEFPRVLNRTDLRVSFLVSIREDSLAKLDRFKGRVPNLFENYLRVEHLDRAAASDAIKKPVEQYNKLFANGREVSIEPGLVETVLDQVRTGTVVLGERGRGVVAARDTEKQIETPYLQLVMTRLWEEEVKAQSGVLRLETLSRLGGAERIVRTHLDKAIGGLPREEQDIAAQAFHFLVTPGGTKIAHTISDLSGYADLPELQLTSVLEKLSGGDIRILRAIQPAPDQPAAPRYEIFHDVLASAILDWRARYSLARERRRVIRLRLGVAGLTAFLLALLVLIVFVLIQRQKADSQMLAATAISQLSVDPHSSLALALEAADKWPTKEAEFALRKSFTDSALLLVLRGHQKEVNTARFSPDSRLVVTASDDHTARIWDSAEGRCLFILEGHQNRVKSATFDPEGKRILTASDDHTATIWDATNGKPVHVLRAHKAELTGANFSPNGRFVVTASADTARVWDASTGDLIAELKEHSDRVNTAAFSPDSKFVLTASNDTTARVWDPRTGKPIALLAGHTGSLTSASFSPDPDGKNVVTASEDGVARIWDATNWSVRAVLKGHEGWVIAAALDERGKVLTAGSDKSTRIWNLATPVAQYLSHTDRVKCAEFSPDFRFVLTASDDGTAVLSDATELRVVAVLKGHSGAVNSASFSSDGRLIVTASRDQTARIWEANAERSPSVIDGNASDICNTMISADGKYTLIRDEEHENTLKLLESSSKTEISVLSHEQRIKTAAFDRSGNLIVTASLDGSARVWKRDGTEISLLRANASGLKRAAFSPDSAYVVTCSAERTYGARVWNVKTREQVGHLQGHTAYVNDAIFSPNGRFIVLASDDSTVTVWEWQEDNTNPVVRLRGHTSVVQSVAFSPNGAFLITASPEGTGAVRIWDTANWQNLAVIHTNLSSLSRAAFSPDGPFIVANGSNAIQVYECLACGPFEQLVKLAQIRLSRTGLPVKSKN